MIENENINFETLFTLPDIVDDGFSKKVNVNVRKQLWIRHGSLALAVIAGAFIAFLPFVDLLGAVISLLTEFSVKTTDVTVAPLVNLPTFIIPFISIVLILFIVPLIEN